MIIFSIHHGWGPFISGMRLFGSRSDPCLPAAPPRDLLDYEPAQAIKSRKAILDRVATDRVMAMGYHFPFPAIGHVVRHDTAYHWEAAKWAW